MFYFICFFRKIRFNKCFLFAWHVNTLFYSYFKITSLIFLILKIMILVFCPQGFLGCLEINYQRPPRLNSIEIRLVKRFISDRSSFGGKSTTKFNYNYVYSLNRISWSLSLINVLLILIEISKPIKSDQAGK